jgi:hypothetical protein
MEEVYKDDTTVIWVAIKIDRNKLKETRKSQTRRKLGIKRKLEHACDTLQKEKRDATYISMDSFISRELIT